MTEDRPDSFRGSPQQDEQWRREPTGPSGRIQALVRLDGQLDPPALSTALRRVVERHESLRTTFTRQAGIRVPLQVVRDALEPGWEQITALAPDPGAHLEVALAGERERPLDFERGPLLRSLLIDLAADRHVLVLTASSLCADAGSMSLLVRELAHHYGDSTELVEDVLQYADFSAWQLELSESVDDEAHSARETWGELAGATTPCVPFARGSSATFAPDEVAVRLEAFATPALVHAAWYALLRRVAGEQRVVVSLLSPDRRHPDLAGAIGAFARPVPIGIQLDVSPPFVQLREDLERARVEALVLQDYAPAETSVDLTIGFSDYDAYRGRAGALAISLERIVTTGAPWRLWLSCPRADTERTARIHFDPACYERESVQRLARQLSRVIADAVADQSTPLDQLQLLDGQERVRVLREFNDTSATVSSARVHELFARHAAATPERDAVFDERGAISYGDLDARANQLANRLLRCGVRPDVPVGLCTDRSIDMVVGLLGILKAGCGYLPLNHEHPAERLRHQLATAGASLIVTQEKLLAGIPSREGEILCLDRAADRAAVEAESATAPDVPLCDESLAYVIYTSGSTGAPKGVAVTHGNLTNYVADITRRLGADSVPLAFGLVTSISTDLGNTSVFGALASGGTLVLISPAAASDGDALARQLGITPIDVVKITPSHLAALLTGDDAMVLPRRTLVVGGERASWELIDRVRALSSCAIVNHYGPTEATIGCCTFAVQDGPGPYQPATVPIGRPISNASCYVLDDAMNPSPIGVPGTLFVGGAGVARGYIGQPELTDELFLADPFCDSHGGRMYNTGDTVRWLPNGTLEFLGRSDEQVKIRGYRVEPAELESALRSHPQIAQAAVVAAETGSGEARLVAYCTSKAAVGDAELRVHLAGLLPEFMLPSALVMLDEMPRTPSGKIDRRSLPDPATVSGPDAAGYLAPRTPIEEAIATLWSQTLGIERVGVEDDFFELGGHSLLATQVVARVRSELAVDLPLHSLFTCPTVELLAAEVVQLMGASEEQETAELLAELEGLTDEEARNLLGAEATQPDGGDEAASSPNAPTSAITRRPDDGPRPLSFPQERLFLLDQIMPGLPAYNVPTLVRVRRTLDPELIRAACELIIARHEILRTALELRDGEPAQEVRPQAPFELIVSDLRSHPAPDREAQAHELLCELAQRPFDLSCDVLLRAALIHVGRDEDLLLVVLHHIGSDHASSALLFTELDAIYTALAAGHEPTLPELPIQYADFAEWQRRQLAGTAQDRLLEHWADKLAGAPERLDLPTDRPRPSAQSYRGELREFTVDPATVASLRELARREGVSMFMVLLAAFKTLLHRYGGGEDVVVGAPISGRRHDEIASLLGCFSNTLALRTDLSGDPPFSELLARVKATTLDAQVFQELPFEKLVMTLNPDRAQSHSPIFQVLFGFDVEPPERPAIAGHVLEELPVPGWKWSRFDLSIVVREAPDGSLQARLEYATDLYDATTIERLIGHFETLLGAAARDPRSRLSELPMLSEQERRQLLADWNSTSRAYDGRCLHDQFSDQARRTPGEIALVCGAERITYRELDLRSNQLARALHGLGVGKGVLVGICIERSVELVIAMLGALKSGAAYVPIEPTYPPLRQEFILADAGAPVLITQERLMGIVDPRAAKVLCVDRDRERIAAYSAEPLELTSDPDELAYVIYTSGSTGQPKGVEVGHRSVANLLAQMRERPGIGDSDVLANLTTPAFDLSVPDWYLPLTSGARLVIVPRESTLDGVELADWLARTGATIAQATPTTWQMLVDAGWNGSGRLKIVCGGEALSRELAEELLGRGASVWHMYGPTETTVWSSAIELGTGDGPPPLGGPIANTRFYVLDAQRQPVPIGVPGELYIGGDGLARGYHRRGDLTSEKFVEDPFAGGSGERLYRTGDLMRWRETGTLEFLGRSDDQVKLRGFRIELQEIETVLRSDPAVAAAAVTVREDPAGDRRLAAYVVPVADHAVDEEQLRRVLKSSLPPFMVPSWVVALDGLPITPNGKIDRPALPPPDEARRGLERSYAGPENPLEEALASIWREVLGVNHLGIDDDFFDLGGHSLLAVKMLARVRDGLGLSPPLRELFDSSTIRELSELLAAELVAGASGEDLTQVLTETQR